MFGLHTEQDIVTFFTFQFELNQVWFWYCKIFSFSAQNRQILLRTQVSIWVKTFPFSTSWVTLFAQETACSARGSNIPIIWRFSSIHAGLVKQTFCNSIYGYTLQYNTFLFINLLSLYLWFSIFSSLNLKVSLQWSITVRGVIGRGYSCAQCLLNKIKNKKTFLKCHMSKSSFKRVQDRCRNIFRSNFGLKTSAILV